MECKVINYSRGNEKKYLNECIDSTFVSSVGKFVDQFEKMVAAESLGSYVGDTHTGLFGTCGVLSFNGNKTITTGGGGMIITNNEEFGEIAHKYSDFFTEIGMDYVTERQGTRSNYWLNAIKFKSVNERNEFLEYTNNRRYNDPACMVAYE